MSTKENVQFSPTLPYSRYVDPEVFNEESKRSSERVGFWRGMQAKWKR